jgi:hypothetical protein
MYWDRKMGEVPICIDVDREAIMKDFWLAMDNLPA